MVEGVRWIKKKMCREDDEEDKMCEEESGKQCEQDRFIAVVILLSSYTT